MVALLAAPLWLLNPWYFWAMVGGYGPHRWIDMLNIRDVDLFWPAPVRRVTPGNRNWRLQVGSKAERVLLSGLRVAAAALVPLSHVGFRDALQAVLQSFDIAVEQYARVSGTHGYDLELTATDHLTLERIHCRCPVVGTWKNGFIVLHDGQPRAVGKSEAHHNLLPVAARLIEGEPLRVVAERVAMQGHTLRWLPSRIDQSRPVALPAGRGGNRRSVESYNPASYRGGILRLHDARAPELEPWLDLVAVRGEVVVQFWLKPGEAAVTLGPGKEREVERIPEQLRRFL